MTPRDWYAAVKTALEFHLRRFGVHWIISLAAIVLIFGGGYALLFAAPASFPQNSIAVVTKGESAAEVARAFGVEHIVAHPLVLRILLRASGQGGNVRTGAYRFITPENALTVAYRLVAGSFGIAPQKITLIEGDTARQMATKIAAVFPEVSESDFLAIAEPYEGYLFPDTYSFAPDASAGDMVAAMRANFNARIAPLMGDITTSGHSLSDIVIMASIVEKEANNPTDMQMVAGILWNRIKLGMPLQVDAVFGYIHDRATYSPSYADLTVDSPYNTYKHVGLPPGPISNPGLNALTAATNPTKTKYLYYLTGKDGLMHYATTYAGQLANENRYLK